MESKKGIQLNQAFAAVLALVLVAVLVIIAIVIFVSLETAFAGTTAVTNNNETITTVTESGEILLGASNCSFGGLSIAAITNATGGETIAAPNYTVTAASGTVAYSGVVDDSGYNGTNWNVSYSYTFGSEACQASQSTATEFGNYTSLVGLVGTIIFLGLVIGILVAAFVFGGRRET